MREKAELEAKIKHLENDVYKLRLERDVLEKAGDILKKEMGISLDELSNREKVFLVDALRNKYKLNELLSCLKLPKSSYCYQVQCINREDKYKELVDNISPTLLGVNKDKTLIFTKKKNSRKDDETDSACITLTNTIKKDTILFFILNSPLV